MDIPTGIIGLWDRGLWEEVLPAFGRLKIDDIPLGKR